MMPPTAPTRQALRHLRRICSSPQLATRTNPQHFTSHSVQPICAVIPRIRPGQQRSIATSCTRLQEAQPSSSTRSDAADPRTPSIPDITNFYTLFPKTLSDGPPPSGSFQIPLGPLKREYLQLQSQHHPDKYTSQPTAHQKALALSSLLNTAYKTLSDPLLRARYLLQHNYDVDITSEDNSTHRDLTDHDTLMEVMEAQEAIEEAQTQEKIDALREENRGRIEQTIQLLGEAFEIGDVDAAKTECIRLNYWNSLQQGLHEWEPGKEVRLIH
ncbi:Fe-S protein assembly co-chaperone HscB [Exophiala sideris]|uniref:Fe-S protein assembly co-chaperone HscB n=1 Tax=Exophiala sideris TaxID=1016849 RepID=A0A0D1WCY4_9EURO|nr:Fe-S protein assembly co-chaperone HscB [Exophiala sideris]